MNRDEIRMAVVRSLEGIAPEGDAALLGGLYGFPQVPQDPSSRRKSGSRVAPGMTELGIVTHTYSHFKLIGTVLLIILVVVYALAATTTTSARAVTVPRVSRSDADNSRATASATVSSRVVSSNAEVAMGLLEIGLSW